MNVKPGDLAIVIGVQNYPENIGKLVVVLRPHKKGDLTVTGDAAKVCSSAQYWWVESCGSPITKKGSPHIQAHIQDRHLRPIRPTEEPVTTQREEEMQK